MRISEPIKAYITIITLAFIGSTAANLVTAEITGMMCAINIIDAVKEQSK